MSLIITTHKIPFHPHKTDKVTSDNIKCWEVKIWNSKQELLHISNNIMQSYKETCLWGLSGGNTDDDLEIIKSFFFFDKDVIMQTTQRV